MIFNVLRNRLSLNYIPTKVPSTSMRNCKQVDVHISKSKGIYGYMLFSYFAICILVIICG